MSAQHTPGPWRYNPLIGAIFAETETGPDAAKKTISIVRVPLNDHEMHANARLIAAAPDLLAALRDAIDHMAAYERAFPLVDVRELHKARAAIARAEGRTP